MGKLSLDHIRELLLSQRYIFGVRNQPQADISQIFMDVSDHAPKCLASLDNRSLEIDDHNSDISACKKATKEHVGLLRRRCEHRRGQCPRGGNKCRFTGSPRFKCLRIEDSLGMLKRRFNCSIPRFKSLVGVFLMEKRQRARKIRSVLVKTKNSGPARSLKNSRRTDGEFTESTDAHLDAQWQGIDILDAMW